MVSSCSKSKCSSNLHRIKSSLSNQIMFINQLVRRTRKWEWQEVGVARK